MVKFSSLILNSYDSFFCFFFFFFNSYAIIVLIFEVPRFTSSVPGKLNREKPSQAMTRVRKNEMDTSSGRKYVDRHQTCRPRRWITRIQVISLMAGEKTKLWGRALYLCAQCKVVTGTSKHWSPHPQVSQEELRPFTSGHKQPCLWTPERQQIYFSVCVA